MKLQLNTHEKNTRRKYLLILVITLISCMGLAAIGATDLFTGGSNSMEQSTTLLVDLGKKAFWVALLVIGIVMYFKHSGKQIAEEIGAAIIVCLVRLGIALYENGSIEATINLIAGWFGGAK